MVTNCADNNHLTLAGKITSDKRFSHETYGENFYIFDLEVPRLSGNADIIPVTISERLITNFDLDINKQIKIEGQFRSYNSYENEKSRLVLTVFTKNIQEIENEDESIKEKFLNEVILKGYVCKKPVYRQTPFGREISDILLAVNRAYNKSDYIPCICWGRTARFCENMPVGTEVKIIGRVQSRIYEKKFEDGTAQTRVAYEVSVSNLEGVGEDSHQPEEDNVEADTVSAQTEAI